MPTIKVPAGSTSRPPRLRRPTAALVACLLAVGGCGGAPEQERFPLHGSVRVDGADVKQGVISLLPSAGNSGPAASTVIQAGRYAFDLQTGPGGGPHRVVIAVDSVATATEAGDGDPAADAPPDLAAMKRSPARSPSGGTSRPPNASKQNAGTGQPLAENRPGQWETTYTVPRQGDFQKDFELTKLDR